MKFDILYLTSTSVTLELENKDCYYSKSSFNVYLNGELVTEGEKRNVFSLFNLEPNTAYTVKVEAEESYTHTFMTTDCFVKLDVRKFRAYGDGVHDDTLAIQAAIAACPKDGIVYVPKGTYLCKPLFMKSNMTLELAKEAVILGSQNRDDYPILPGITEAVNERDEYQLGSWEGNPLDQFASLITGINVENVNIIGEGVIDGNAAGSDWWVNAKVRRVAWRPKTIFFTHSTNITLQGIHVQNSPSWTIHPLRVDGFYVYDVKIYNPSDSPNTDGIDPECCTSVHVIGTNISVGDDCVVIKSGKVYTAKYFMKRSEDLVIRNCYMQRGHGSVVLGSEISCGVDKISVSQCVFDDTDRGLRIKTRRGRGEESVIDNIVFENIIMNDVKAPFTINMHYKCDPDGNSPYVQSEEVLPVDEYTPFLGKFHFKNIECTNVHWAASYFVGLPEQKIEKIHLENVSFSFAERAESGEPIMVTIPETTCKMGIFAKNVKHLELDNVRLFGQDGEKLITDRVDQVNLHNEE